MEIYIISSIINITSYITCEYFRNFEDGYGVDEPKGIFYFADITAIQLLLSTIGAAKDPEPLLAKNFIQARNRKWYQAHITPLSANLVIMLFKYVHDYLNFFLII